MSAALTDDSLPLLLGSHTHCRERERGVGVRERGGRVQGGRGCSLVYSHTGLMHNERRGWGCTGNVALNTRLLSLEQWRSSSQNLKDFRTRSQNITGMVLE